MAELCRDYYVDRIVSRAALLAARAFLVRRADELSRRTVKRHSILTRQPVFGNGSD
jgi:hypothetical protein